MDDILLALDEIECTPIDNINLSKETIETVYLTLQNWLMLLKLEPGQSLHHIDRLYGSSWQVMTEFLDENGDIVTYRETQYTGVPEEALKQEHYRDTKAPWACPSDH